MRTINPVLRKVVNCDDTSHFLDMRAGLRTGAPRENRPTLVFKHDVQLVVLLFAFVAAALLRSEAPSALLRLLSTQQTITGSLTMNSLLSLLPFPSPSCHTSFPSSSTHGICLWAGWRFTHSAPVVVVRSIHDDRRSLRIWPRLHHHHHHHHRHYHNDSDCMRRESWSARRRAGAGVGDVPSPSSSSSSFSGSEEKLEVSEAPEQQELCGTTVR